MAAAVRSVRVEDVRERTRALAENPDLAAIIVKARDRGKLTPVEDYRIGRAYNILLAAWNAGFSAHKRGSLERGDANSTLLSVVLKRERVPGIQRVSERVTEKAASARFCAVNR